jgi:hypothetical protein
LVNHIELEEGSKIVYFDQEVEKDKISNLADRPTIKKVHEVNMITSLLDNKDYEPSEELNNDDYSMDSADYEDGDRDLEYQVPREQPVPRVVKRDLYYRDITKRYNFKCYG